MFDHAFADHDLSQLGAAATTANDLPYGLPVEQVTENLSVAGQDLTTIAFDAVSDHILLGETKVNFAIKNQGSQDIGRFEADIVYSRNGKIGDRDDIVVGTYSFNRIAAGDTLVRSVNVEIDDLAALNVSATRDDRAGRGPNYQSRNQDFLGLVIDPENQISESNERNNSIQKDGIGRDDVTYFPWDLNDDGVVSASEAQFARNQLGRPVRRNNEKVDFDGDGVITETDVNAIADRVGYRINPKITEPSIVVQQPKDGKDFEPMLEGVIAEVSAVKKVQARFANAPGQRFVNITRDIGKAGEFTLEQNQLEKIYGDKFPNKTQRLVIEALDNRGQVITSKTISYRPNSSQVEFPPRDPGNTTARAFRIGNLNRKRTFGESVSDADALDYYQFKLKTVSNVEFGLNVLDKSFDADLTIVDASGNTVFNPAETTNFIDESDSTLLEAGTYYALVSENGFRGSTGYRLSLEATAVPDARPRVDPGNSTASAFGVGSLGDTQTLTAFVSDSDRLDYYEFKVDAVSNVTFGLNVINKRFDADLTIVDASGNTVFNPAETTNFIDESDSTLLEAGTYYALVSENGFRDGTAYELSLGATELVGNLPSRDPGETPVDAIKLGSLGSTQTQTAFVSDSDRLDYYEFDIDAVSNVTFDLNVINKRFDADLTIVDAFGNTVFNPAETTNFIDESDSTLLEVGTYYALVSENGFRGGTAYDLKLKATAIRNNVPALDPGNTLAAAFDLGALSNGTQKLRSFVSDSDPLDYYQFRLSGNKNLRVQLDVTSDRFDADVEILDSTGRRVFDVPETTNFIDEVGSVRLSGGIYYALVSENGFRDGTEYQLKLGVS